MKILIAEDNLLNQQLMSRYMCRLGWEFMIVDNGAYKTNIFDVILMDIDMPMLNGIEAARYIRIFDKAIPIIAITAYADEQMKADCAGAGMNDYLAKPCSQNQIVEVVSECVEIVSCGIQV